MRMLAIFLAVAFLAVINSCSYTGNARGLECNLAHSWKGRELHVEARLRNTGTRAVTIVQHPVFCRFAVTAVGRSWLDPDEYVSDLVFKRARRSALKTLKPGKGEVVFQDWSKIESRGAHTWFVPMMGIASSEGFMTDDPRVRVVFSVEWFPHMVREISRIAKPNIFTGALEVSSIVRLDRRTGPGH
jgi:hypothetical protein